MWALRVQEHFSEYTTSPAWLCSEFESSLSNCITWISHSKLDLKFEVNTRVVSYHHTIDGWTVERTRGRPGGQNSSHLNCALRWALNRALEFWTDEWIRKLWYIYTMEYYSAIKRNAFGIWVSSNVVETLHIDITRWSIPKSDWLYSIKPKMEKLYTVSKNKTRSWLWLRSWKPYCQIQT